ncbi:MAG: fimbrillin family protein [Bacteroidales bacterium]|nr:fimbrillin family protein [Bacteroidales bacterium]
MKRIFMMGLMLASAFALTNCSEEIAQPAPDFNEPAGEVQFEIYAPAAQTKTANDGMSTVWVENDQINVFHAEAGAASYVNDGVFAIYKQNLADGLFLGALKQPLTASAYDWYFFYPYTIGMKTPAGDAVVTLAGKTQTQKGNSNMAHIAGVNYPMCAVVKNVAAEETPAGEMKHMSALVAINVINNTDAPMNVVSAGLGASEDIVGTYYMDFTGEEVVYTPSGDEYVSKVANLEVVGGESIEAGASAKFYLAVKPFTAEAESRLTVYVNGSRKSITLPETTEFKAGKIKTINVTVDPIQHELSTSSTIKSNHLVAGDYTVTNNRGKINGVATSYIVKVGTEENTGSIILKGSLKDFINMKEMGFFAASWTGRQGALTIAQVAVKFPEGGMRSSLLGADLVMTAEEIAAMIAEQSGQEIDMDKLMFKPVPAGMFNDDDYKNHNLTILDEELHYYGITEDELNEMVASTGLSVDDLRALINGEGDIIETLGPILESFGVDLASIEQYIPIIEMLLPEIRAAQLAVTLSTTTADQAGNTYDPRVVIWGMNIFFNE